VQETCWNRPGVRNKVTPCLYTANTCSYHVIPRPWHLDPWLNLRQVSKKKCEDLRSVYSFCKWVEDQGVFTMARRINCNIRAIIIGHRKKRKRSTMIHGGSPGRRLHFWEPPRWTIHSITQIVFNSEYIHIRVYPAHFIASRISESNHTDVQNAVW